jgi:hypothetical protein
MSKSKQLLRELNYIENADDNNFVQNLLRAPLKDKSFEAATTTCPTENYINQIDLLFLPEDDTEIEGSAAHVKREFAQVNRSSVAEKKKPFKKDCGYKYLLVCVDIATSMCDAEPIKYKYPYIVRDAVKRIYDRKILETPHEIEVDAGNEFKSDFSTYFNTVSHVRRKKAGRHRAQAVVEGINSLLSKIIQTRMVSEEIINKEHCVEWGDEIPEIIKVVNKYFYHKPPQTDVKKHIPIKVKKGYTRNQLQVVLANEKKPPKKLRKRQIVEKILKRIVKGKNVSFEILWDTGEVTTEPRTSLIKDIPGLIEEFEDIEENEPEIISQFKIRNKIYSKVKYGNGETVDEPKIQFIKRFPTIIEEYEQSLTEES